MAKIVSCPECRHPNAVEDDPPALSATCQQCGRSLPDWSAPPVARSTHSLPGPRTLLNYAGRAAWVIILLLASLPAALLIGEPWIAAPRTPSRANTSRNNLKNLALALVNYETQHGHFPPAYIADDQGRPMHSWRVLILPYLENRPLFEAYDMSEPWNGPHNSQLHKYDLEFFISPFNKTKNVSYLLVTGPGTLFEPGRVINSLEISDGAENTVMLVECIDSGIHWMEPRDLSIDTVRLVPHGIPGQDMGGNPSGTNVAFADAHVRAINYGDVHPKQLRALLTRDGGEPNPLYSPLGAKPDAAACSLTKARSASEGHDTGHSISPDTVQLISPDTGQLISPGTGHPISRDALPRGNKP